MASFGDTHVGRGRAVEDKYGLFGSVTLAVGSFSSTSEGAWSIHLGIVSSMTHCHWHRSPRAQRLPYAIIQARGPGGQELWARES